MTIRYFWHLGDFLILDRPDEAAPADARPLSFTEFRDLVQCLARGGRLVTTAEGRPQVRGTAWPSPDREPEASDRMAEARGTLLKFKA